MALTPSQLVAPVAYVAVAIAAAVAVPELVDAGTLGSTRLTGILIGILVVLAGALVQEVLARREAVAELRGRLMSLGDHTLRLREDVRKVRAVVRTQAEQAPEDRRELDSVVAEMRMLKGLVEQLSARREAALARGEEDGEDSGALAPRRPRGIDLTDDSAVLDAVRDALNDDRVELYLNPIVTLPQRRLQFFECVAHVRAYDGTIIPPERYLPLAEREGLSATIDNMLLVRSVQFVRRMKRRAAPQPVTYFCTIASETLRDRDFFADFTAFMRENDDLAGLLSFSLTQHDLYRLDPRTDAELTDLSKLGFRFMLDQTTNLDLFVSDLSTKGFRYVKVEGEVMLEKMAGMSDPRALKRSLDPGALDLVVTGIDSETKLLKLLDFAIDFGQGRIFGEPRPAEPR